MSIPFLPPKDDALDTHVDNLDSFELSDEQNVSDDYMSHHDAETEVFDSAGGSSCFKPDTTTRPSPPSKIKLLDPSIQPTEKDTNYKYICSHLQVAKFKLIVVVAGFFFLPHPIDFRVLDSCIYQDS